MARKLSFWEGIKAQFSTKCLVLIPIAVGINLIGGTLCSALKLPLFLDMIGTIVVACLSGPWVAALTGLLTNLFLALVANPVYLPYAAVSVLCGLVVGYMVRPDCSTRSGASWSSGWCARSSMRSPHR